MKKLNSRQINLALYLNTNGTYDDSGHQAGIIWTHIPGECRDGESIATYINDLRLLSDAQLITLDGGCIVPRFALSRTVKTVQNRLKTA